MSSEDESPLQEEESPDVSQSSLFQCPSCDVVYVANEKTGCSQCEEPVVEI